MKKTALLMIFLVVMFLAVLAMPIYAKEVSITEENIALLKDRWEGDRSVSLVRSSSKTEYRKTEVEITNGTLPLEGVIILHFKLGEPDRLEFKNGILKNGKIFIQREDVREWWTFNLYSKGEKMELRGEYQIVKPGGYELLTGNFILTKKIVKTLVATFDELFRWTAKRVNVVIDPAKPLPTIVRLSSKELQELYRKTKGQSSKRSTGLYVDTPTSNIYVVEGGDDGITVHEISHYFQYRYKLDIVDYYLKDCQLVDGLIPNQIQPSEEFWEAHALQVEYDYCQEFGLHL